MKNCCARRSSAISADVGYEVGTSIRSPAELNRIANHCTFPLLADKAAGHSVLVAFLSASPSREDIENLIACQSETNEFHVSIGKFIGYAKQD